METQFQKRSTATQNAKFPEEYPTQDAFAAKFGINRVMVSYLLGHYEFLSSVIKDVSSATIVTRVTMLPEGVTREVRRAPADVQPKLLMDKFPEEYPTQDAVALRFGLSQNYVAKLVQHYEFSSNVTAALSSNTISTRVLMLPEGITREVHQRKMRLP